MSEHETETTTNITTEKARALASLIPGVPESVIEWIILKVINKKNAEQQDEGRTE